MPQISYASPASQRYSTADTCPVLSTTLTGTVTAPALSKSIVGTGTLFLTELPLNQPYGFMVDLTNKEVRRITDVDDNTHLWLEAGFTNALSADAFIVCPVSGAQRIDIQGESGTGAVDGVPMPSNDTITYQSSEHGIGYQRPLVVESASAFITY